MAGIEAGPEPMSFDLRGPMWNAHTGIARHQRKPPTTLEERLQNLEDQSAIADLLAQYTYYYDAKDVDGLLTVFHPDCVLINPRGTYIGHDAIRRNYAYLMEQSKVCFHYASNAAVRVGNDRKRSWMTAYYYDISATKNGKLIGTGGTYADELVLVGDSWKIIARRITYNFRHALVPEPPSTSTPPPAPSKPESSRDILGPDVEM